MPADYIEGAFRKTLLQSVSQYGSNKTFSNKHEFSYYDTVRDSQGGYQGLLHLHRLGHDAAMTSARTSSASRSSPAL